MRWIWLTSVALFTVKDGCAITTQRILGLHGIGDLSQKLQSRSGWKESVADWSADRLKSGKVGKKLIYYAHFHGSGGSSLCSFAKRAAQNSTSGVHLAPRQLDKTACNLWDWKRNGDLPHEPISSCSSVANLAEKEKSSWIFVETALDVKPPCKSVAFVVTFRAPWDRMKSLLKQSSNAADAALHLTRSMQIGDPIVSPSSPVSWTGWPPAVFDPIFQTGVFDNFYVRFLLGTLEGRELPWGTLTEEHLARAQAALEAFDVVAPEQGLGAGNETLLYPLQQALGKTHFDLGLTDEAHGGLYRFGRRENVHKEDADQILQSQLGANGLEELERRFRSTNHLDEKLYNWVVSRWQKQRLAL